MISRRTRGSPPVMRSFSTPSPMKVEHIRSSSSSVSSSFLGQEGHVLGHAIDAAEIAAVGDRDAQVADGALERVYEWRGHGSETMPVAWVPQGRM